VQARNAVDGVLEIQEFVADAFLDEDAAGVLVDDGLFVLEICMLVRAIRIKWEEEDIR
jgi:hypothetical protein